MKMIFNRLLNLVLLTGICFLQTACAQKPLSADNIRLNQIGYYPNGPKVAVLLTDKTQKYNIVDGNKRVVFSGETKQSAHPDMSGETISIADFSTLQQPGNYTLELPDGGHSYPFAISATVHSGVAAGSIKGFYFQRVSIDLPEKYAGKWARPAGHPDDQVLVHPSAASPNRPEGTVISSPRGWYDAGDYNKYIVNSGISMGTLLSLYEDFPAHMKTVKLNIPESNNQIPDLLDEVLYNLRWMLTMQDPGDGGVYHKLTNADFDGMIMPDKATKARYVVKKGTAATLDFAAVMAQASRVLKSYNKQLPGLADSCLTAAVEAWQWAAVNPNAVYDQRDMAKIYAPAITTGEYGDRYFGDEFIWAASELYITTGNDEYLKRIPVTNVRLSVPGWAHIGTLGYYSLLRNRDKLTPEGKKQIPGLSMALIVFADSLLNNGKITAYQTVMGAATRDFGWGSNSGAANQGIALLQAYLLTHDVKYANAALSNLDYLLGRNGTGYSFLSGFGDKPIMHPHHRPSIADGVAEPVPGLLSGGPNPGKQDGVALPSSVPNQAFIDDDQAYAANEIAINWNAPFAYLANAIEALQYDAGYVKK